MELKIPVSIINPWFSAIQAEGLFLEYTLDKQPFSSAPFVLIFLRKIF